MLLALYATYWLLGVLAASLVSYLRGYTATYGFFFGVLAVAIPLAGPALAVVGIERATRPLPERPVNPVRWPFSGS